MMGYLHFDGIKEHRDTFFVEYHPPVADNPFATLNLIFPNPVSWERVNELLNKEVHYWMKRYQVPLMAWVLDDKEDAMRPPGQDEDCLVAWADPASGEVVQSWNLDDLNTFLKVAPPPPDWRTIYTDVPVRTAAEVKAITDKKIL